jgi:hypothetical protein
MKVEASAYIDRPLAATFAWYADDHVRNHPRWDPDIELEAISGQPLRVGSVIRRRNVRYGASLEGTMEVVEFERDRAFGVVIREGGLELPGRVTFRSVMPSRTLITIATDVPDTLDRTLVTERMRRSAENIKQLMEAEL